MDIAATESSPVLPDLFPTCLEALSSAQHLLLEARRGVSALVIHGGRLDGALLDRHQFAAHGYAWLATYVAGLQQMLVWAERLEEAGRLNELENLMLQTVYGEYLAQIAGGVAMTQVEVVRPRDMGVSDEAVHAFWTPAVAKLIKGGNTDAARMRIARLIADGNFGNPGLDETLEMVRDQFRRFAEEKVIAFAHGWHERDELIPMESIDEMAELGVFGLTIPEQYGGLAMEKMAMCVVTEELSRGYIGVGSLGTRSEIAAELIRLGGTDEQKQYWLPKLASGEILPTAVFTEPNYGSDLASIRTRAERQADGSWKLFGQKTWITHATRTDLMTVLARSLPDQKGYKGLSMFLASKTRGREGADFPDAGITGTEIKV